MQKYCESLNGYPGPTSAAEQSYRCNDCQSCTPCCQHARRVHRHFRSTGRKRRIEQGERRPQQVESSQECKNSADRNWRPNSHGSDYNTSISERERVCTLILWRCRSCICRWIKRRRMHRLPLQLPDSAVMPLNKAIDSKLQGHGCAAFRTVDPYVRVSSGRLGKWTMPVLFGVVIFPNPTFRPRGVNFASI